MLLASLARRTTWLILIPCASCGNRPLPPGLEKLTLILTGFFWRGLLLTPFQASAQRPSNFGCELPAIVTSTPLLIYFLNLKQMLSRGGRNASLVDAWLFPIFLRCDGCIKN